MYWNIKQGNSRARVSAPDHATAAERARQIGFDSPESIVLDESCDMGQSPRSLTCDMMRGCTAPVSHVDAKGFLYCANHGETRKSAMRCRQLTRAELARLKSGRSISY